MAVEGAVACAVGFGGELLGGLVTWVLSRGLASEISMAGLGVWDGCGGLVHS